MQYLREQHERDTVYGNPGAERELAKWRNNMFVETTAKALVDEDLVIQVRQYISLRKELKERGDVIVKAIAERGKTLVVLHGDEAFEVSKSYSVGGDMPLNIRAAEVLGMQREVTHA